MSADDDAGADRLALDDKAEGAFRTIAEVSALTGVAPHVLRFWETRFPELKPMKRAGNRRYYRPADVELVRTLDRLLNGDGYTIKGAQQVVSAAPAAPVPAPGETDDLLPRLRAIRDRLAAALDASS